MNPLLGARIREVVLNPFENPGISRGHISFSSICSVSFLFKNCLKVS